VLNAANEVVVQAFLDGRTGFPDMPAIIEKTMGAVGFIKSPDLDDLIQTNIEARNITKSLIGI
jgi:1-deoxy-D-xylulose-5-phosphate reductoisomerase